MTKKTVEIELVETEAGYRRALNGFQTFWTTHQSLAQLLKLSSNC